MLLLQIHQRKKSDSRLHCAKGDITAWSEHRSDPIQQNTAIYYCRHGHLNYSHLFDVMLLWQHHWGDQISKDISCEATVQGRCIHGWPLSEAYTFFHSTTAASSWPRYSNTNLPIVEEWSYTSFWWLSGTLCVRPGTAEARRLLYLEWPQFCPSLPFSKSYHILIIHPMSLDQEVYLFENIKCDLNCYWIVPFWAVVSVLRHARWMQCPYHPATVLVTGIMSFTYQVSLIDAVCLRQLWWIQSHALLHD